MKDLTGSVKVPLAVRMVIFCILFTVFMFVIGYGMAVLNTQTIYMENGSLMPAYLKIVFTAAAAVVETGLLFMIVSLWKRIFKDGAMTLTQQGIENTFMIFTVLAFWTTLRIRFIPWEALKVDESDENRYTVDTEQLPPDSVGAVAKFLLKVMGFHFRIGRIKKEDLERYRQAALARKGKDKV